MLMTVPSWREIRDACVLMEDESVLVLNKPAGISVMGERHGTDLVELAAEAGEQLYPAHRVDKVTSGVVLFAKDLATHGGLTRQFNKRTVDKAYLVVTATTGLPDQGTIELPLGVGRKNKVRIAAAREAIRADAADGRWWVAEEDVLDGKNYPSTTHVRTLWSDGEHSVLIARPVTGRRHQIRVHLAWIGHPILGDPLFDKAAAAAGLRTHLHSWRLGFDASWRDGSRVDVAAEPDDGFWEPLAGTLSADAIDRLLRDGARLLRPA
ncbi:RNA pseudouridine synthase [Streptomyces sp. NBC_01808]|uniref:RluA family pseudouridine synthase n=1 Tax=Streptomyces sp. NBC_01808 TaxID=2975947 RepID=UPI002DD91EDF|nr:RNA pseudouridine synthase [Streptomyces sp. NBC_01808]WSA36378.1 RNA pseudouridine synthase [Streptomyces sp. NBC_01808]